MKTAIFLIQSVSRFALACLLLFSSRAAAAGNSADSSRYQFISIDLAVQGETFTGTIMEKKEKGYFPLAAGCLVSIQGEVIAVQPGGRIVVPPLPYGSCSREIPIEIFDGGSDRAELGTTSRLWLPPLLFLPRGGTGRTEILATPPLVKPGGFFTAIGEGLDRLHSASLRSMTGAWIPLQEVAGSSIQRKYLLPVDLPEGTYHFEGKDVNGAVVRSPAVSTCPHLEMSGPPLKKVGQKGKVLIRANAGGILTVWGGRPQIEFVPGSGQRQGVRPDGSPVLLIETHSGEWIEIPFVARMTGQYHVTAELRLPEEAKAEYETPTESQLLGFSSLADRLTGTTKVETQVLVRETTGRSAVGIKAQALITYPGGMEMVSSVSDFAGLAKLEAELPGNWPAHAVTVAAFRAGGGDWRQDPLYSVETATAFFGAGGILPDDATPEDEQALADMYRRNKRRWGNYHGLCGTAIWEICTQYPKLCEDIKRGEAEIEEWLRNFDTDSGDSNGSGAPGQRNHSAGDVPSQPVPGDVSRPDETNETSETDEADAPADQDEESESPIPQEDRADLQNEVIKRAFEEHGVTALRILEIKLGYRGAAVTRIGNQYFITYEHEVVFDSKTGQPLNYWEFNKSRTLTAEEWYVIYLLSLGDNPLNLLSRIVESAESLGKGFLEKLFADMQTKGDASRLLEVRAQHLMLLYVTASFDQTAMPQLGDHYRDAEAHMENSRKAMEQGDWTTALEEWQAAQSSMAWLALEVMPVPAGSAGKTAGKVTRRAAKPMIEVAESATRNLDEVVESLRKVARQEPSQDLARQMTRRADALEEMAEKTKPLRRATELGQPRPANFPVAARDRAALEEHFGRNNVGVVGNRKPENVLVITDAGGNRQVWVRPDYADYKGAYEAVHGSIPQGRNVNVDHLQSRTRAAQQDYGYVRLELVDADVNQAWGRHMEKRTVNAGRAGFVEPAGPAPIRYIDQFQWWKLQGIGPERVNDYLRSLTR